VWPATAMWSAATRRYGPSAADHPQQRSAEAQTNHAHDREPIADLRRVHAGTDQERLLLFLREAGQAGLTHKQLATRLGVSETVEKLLQLRFPPVK